MTSPIDDVDPVTQSNECLKIALRQLSTQRALPSLKHIQSVSKDALERIEELEGLVDHATPHGRIDGL